MSNNAAVTADGGEIGRAQALQARAARVPASVHMNPLLLKPESATGSQVICKGTGSTLKARDFMHRAHRIPAGRVESFRYMAAGRRSRLVEGAGSPAEINLRHGDIANMGFAAAADLPVLLVGDVHRGGVIAALVGTFAILDPADATRLKGFIINKFHGDPELFSEATHFLEKRTGTPCLGIVPHFPTPANCRPRTPWRWSAAAKGRRAVPHRRAAPARIANFDDLDPLKLEPGVTVEIVQPGNPSRPPTSSSSPAPSRPSPTSRSCAHRAGTSTSSPTTARRPVLGICGGYQMLGNTIADPRWRRGPPEPPPASACSTSRRSSNPAKELRAETRRDHAASGLPISGYHMHMGVTEGPDRARPSPRRRPGKPEGAIAPMAGSSAPTSTASSPPTPSAPPSLRAWAPPTSQTLATRPRSKRRSTASPPISKRISISTRCSPSPANRGGGSMEAFLAPLALLLERTSATRRRSIRPSATPWSGWAR
jgi:adenosylcobyric acid synthase